jgi:pimeloyl-ACP methyl ester carboxylesterase
MKAMTVNNASEKHFEKRGFKYYTISYPYTGSDKSTKKTFVLIHGLLMNPRFWWKDQVAIFQEYGDVHCISLTGHYPSTLPQNFEGKIDELFLVDMIDDQISELGLEGPFVLAGHSTGALAALVYAIKKGEKLEGLGIFSSPPHGVESGGIYRFFQFLNRDGGPLGRFLYKIIVKTNGISLPFHKVLLGDVAFDKAKMFAYPGFDDWVEYYFPHNKKLVAKNTGTWLRDLYDIDVTDSLGKINVPTLVMFAECDPAMDATNVQTYEDRLKGVERLNTKVLPQTGHLYMYESPEQFGEGVSEWLQQL